MSLELLEEKKSYGCIFCLTGKENHVAECIQVYKKNIRAWAVSQTKRYTTQGVVRLMDDIMLRGYVFFEAPDHINVNELLPPGDILSVLKYSDGDWRLFGEDAEYAKWVYQYKGVLPLSKAYKIGDRISIIDGPLKDLEGMITRIDKRNKSGQVTLNFAGRQQRIWLGFDIVKEVSSYDELLASS